VKHTKDVKRQIAIAAPSVGEEEWQALLDPLTTGWLTQGPKVAAFERAFAARHHVENAVATTSATTALHLSLLALGVGPGDEVIVPAFTWVATANSVIYCGATPIFADVRRDTFNIDPADIERKLTPRTKAVIAVHLFGRCAEVDQVRSVVPPSVSIIEDAACAAGGAYRGKPAGSLGHCGVFSFHPRKSITTGEGGMLTTNDGGLAELVRTLRNHGASIPEEVRHRGPQPFVLPEFEHLGFNYRMTDLQGAVGLVQLGKLDRFVEERSRWAAYYRAELRHLEWLHIPEEPNDGRHAWQAFVLYVDPSNAPQSRNEIMRRLNERGISTRPGTHAVHMLKYYRRRFGLSEDELPVSRDCDRYTMAIPLHNKMSADDYAYVVDVLVHL